MGEVKELKESAWRGWREVTLEERPNVWRRGGEDAPGKGNSTAKVLRLQQVCGGSNAGGAHQCPRPQLPA